MKIVFTKRAFEQYQFWQETDKATLKKINKLIKEIERHPYEGIGKPEALRGDLSGFWSRRIDREHRLVYRVNNDSLEIVMCRFHY